MADEQETKAPDTEEVAEKKEEILPVTVTEAAIAVTKEEEDGEEPKTTKEGGEEAVEAAESTATFEPVVSLRYHLFCRSMICIYILSLCFS